MTITYYRGNEEQTTQLTFDSVPQENQTVQQSETQQPSNNYNGGYDDNWFFDPWEFFFRGSSYSGYDGEAA